MPDPSSSPFVNFDGNKYTADASAVADGVNSAGRALQDFRFMAERNFGNVRLTNINTITVATPIPDGNLCRVGDGSSAAPMVWFINNTGASVTITPTASTYAGRLAGARASTLRELFVSA